MASDQATPTGRGTYNSTYFITGSTDGLSLAAARILMEEGHQIVLHARSQQRTSAFTNLGSGHSVLSSAI
jgi:short-subunit dehydrogenase